MSSCLCADSPIRSFTSAVIKKIRKVCREKDCGPVFIYSGLSLSLPKSSESSAEILQTRFPDSVAPWLCLRFWLKEALGGDGKLHRRKKVASWYFPALVSVILIAVGAASLQLLLLLHTLVPRPQRYYHEWNILLPSQKTKHRLYVTSFPNLWDLVTPHFPFCSFKPDCDSFCSYHWISQSSLFILVI